MQDYWRFTPRGLRALLERAGLVVDTVGTWGNRRCVTGNFDHWPAFRRWHSLRDERDCPSRSGRSPASQLTDSRRVTELDPYANDPDRWGVSLAQSAELMLPCLDAAGARSVVEVGAFAGDLTRCWSSGPPARARASAHRPAPQEALVALAREHPELELIRETSLEALPRDPTARRRRDRRRPQLLHGARGAAAHRRARRRAPSCRCCSSTTSAGRTAAATTTSTPSRSRTTCGSRSPAPTAACSPASPGCGRGGLPYPRSAAREGGRATACSRRSRTSSRRARSAPRGGAGLLRLRRRVGRPGAVGRRGRRASSSRGIATALLARLEANRVHHLARRTAAGGDLEGAGARRPPGGGTAPPAGLERVRRSPSGCRGCAPRRGSPPRTSVVSKDEIRRALGD